MNREEQVERNRAALLAAARRIFLGKGYAGASLEAITAESGFSKGVVYSQFASKGEMFLALLEQRIEERAAMNAKIANTAAGAQGVAALVRAGIRDAQVEADWARLLAEFRVHAARDPALNARYAALHQRTIARLQQTLGELHARAGLKPARPLRLMAEFILAVAAGSVLERAANPDALAPNQVAAMIVAALGLSDGGDS